jgi:hypothetical protein
MRRARTIQVAGNVLGLLGCRNSVSPVLFFQPIAGSLFGVKNAKNTFLSAVRPNYARS